MAVPQPKKPNEQEPEDQQPVPSDKPPVQPVPSPELQVREPLVENFIDQGKLYKSGETVYPDRVAELNQAKKKDRESNQ